MEPYHDHEELHAIDDTKASVKGLLDQGVERLPQIFIQPPDDLDKISSLGATVNLEIPYIDLKGVKTDAMQRKKIVEKVRTASEKWGFFQVMNHGIPINLLEDVIEGVQRFNEQPKEEKFKYYTRNTAQKVRYNSNFDLYQTQWKDTIKFTMAPETTNSEELPMVFRDFLLNFSKHIQELGITMFELLSEALVLSSNHLKDMGCAEGLSLLCHYSPPCPAPELTLATNKHSDCDFLTILLQDHLGGLQVLHQHHWVDVVPVHGALIINVGDFLQIVSNDKFKSSEHRVRANRKGPRISVACFFRTDSPLSTTKLSPVKDLLSEERPPVYRETSVQDYVAYYYQRKTTKESALAHYKVFGHDCD